MILLLLCTKLFTQNNNISGLVIDRYTGQPIEFANVSIVDLGLGSSTDSLGFFKINNLNPGIYNLQVSFIGYKTETIYELKLTPSRSIYQIIELDQTGSDLDEVELTSEPLFSKENPISIKDIGASEIKRSPGGNRDISKVIQSFPGVASSTSFRNDIIIRGGAPNENVFYLDGIEVPNINHFSTQGSSGGPVGMLNVDLIESVDYLSGGFPSNRGNTLSSIFEFSQKVGNPDKLNTNLTLGSSDLALLLDGPLGNNSSFVLSARKSYLQFLFKALQLPFLPEYNDIQFKYLNRLSDQSELTVIGLGAIDNFSLNKEANEGLSDIETLNRNQYILDNIPVNDQWNYTIGSRYRYFMPKGGFHTLVLSRNHLNNTAIKFDDNIENIENLVLDYSSEEIENKFRYEYTIKKWGWDLNIGAGTDYVQYLNETYNKISGANGEIIEINYDSSLEFLKTGFFAQFTNQFFNERVMLSLGLRTDFNNYSKSMSNIFDQFSPRASLSYYLKSNLKFSINSGIYYQLPPYTVMGYRENGVLINKENNLTYIECIHYVSGFEFITKSNTKLSLEGFYKKYDNYPYLVRNSISLANLGADFGVIGDEPVTSSSKGRTYGLEFFAQRKLTKGIYGLLSYTFSYSQFSNIENSNNYLPSSWDQRHIINLCAAKKFSRNWEIGLKWRYTSGSPYTPYNEQISMQADVWAVNGQGILDYNNINSLRNPSFHQLDIRLDKKYYFKKWSLNIYLDIENVYNKVATLGPYLSVERDQSGLPIESSDGSYSPLYIENTYGQFLPSIGIIVEL